MATNATWSFQSWPRASSQPATAVPVRPATWPSSRPWPARSVKFVSNRSVRTHRPVSGVPDPLRRAAAGLIDAQHRRRLRLSQQRVRVRDVVPVRHRPAHLVLGGDRRHAAAGGDLPRQLPAQPPGQPRPRRDLGDRLGERLPRAGLLHGTGTAACASAPPAAPRHMADPAAGSCGTASPTSTPRRTAGSPPRC